MIMLGFFLLLGSVMVLAVVYNVWKYRRDIILGIIVAIAIKVAEYAHNHRV
jgi:hypothetical protein